MTCKDCIHYDVCVYHAPHLVFDDCRYLKDKSRMIELPCKVGDILYLANKGRITTYRIIDIIHYAKKGDNRVVLQNEYDHEEQCSFDYAFMIGYKLFTTREEAEKALAGGNGA